MKHRNFLSLAVVAFAAISISAGKLASSTDQSPDFRGYRTYAWVFSQAPTGMDPANYQTVRESIDRQLMAKGYRPADPGEMAVSFSIGRQDKTQVVDYGAYGGNIYTRLGVKPVFDTVETKTVTEGALAINVYDGSSKQPVWRATASQVLPKRGADKKLVDKAVATLLAKLPAPR